jgi:hypothetical protein
MYISILLEAGRKIKGWKAEATSPPSWHRQPWALRIRFTPLNSSELSPERCGRRRMKRKSHDDELRRFRAEAEALPS